ncbi:MAG: hypothetical protein AB8F95_16725 [Bacteroidia bacterium]
MKTLSLIDAIHTLISRDRIDLALALLRKLLKQVDADMYRQVVQLSWRFSYARTQEMEGQISPDEAMRHRNQLAHSLLELTQSMYRQLPEILPEGVSETADALLNAISDMIKPGPEELRLIGNSSEDKEEPPRGSNVVGIVLMLLSAFAMLGGMARAERSSLAKEQFMMIELASANGLMNLEDTYSHLSLSPFDIQYLFQAGELQMDDLGKMKLAIKQAQEEGREIFTKHDWFVLSGVRKQITFATEKRAMPRPAGQSESRAREF